MRLIIGGKTKTVSFLFYMFFRRASVHSGTQKILLAFIK